MIMRNVSKVDQAYQDQYQVKLFSHSVTPKVDTPDVMLKYGQQFSVKKGKWHLLTGDSQDIFDIARDVYQAETDISGKVVEDFVHTENVYLLDQKRRMRGVYNANSPGDIQRLITDIAGLLKNS